MTDTGRTLSPACIKCGGTEDLMDRAFAPGMTYCRPCRVEMAEQDRHRQTQDEAARAWWDRLTANDRVSIWQEYGDA